MTQKYGKNQRDTTGKLICTAVFLSLALAAGCVGTDNSVIASTTSPTATLSGWNGQEPYPGMRGNATQPGMDLASSAAQLGVTEDQLREALGNPGQGPGNLTSVAARLGVSEQDLIHALRIPGRMPGNQTGQPVPGILP